MKVCGGCKRELPLDSFAWSNVSKGWKDSLCRECHKAYMVEYKAKNREAMNAGRRRCREAKIEQYRAANRAWNRRNKAKVAAARKAYIERSNRERENNDCH